MIPSQFNLTEEGSRIDFLRSHVGNVQEYDIFLAHDIDSQETKKRIQIYEAIDSLCQKLGHKTFVPYRYVGFDGDQNSI